MQSNAKVSDENPNSSKNYEQYNSQLECNNDISGHNSLQVRAGIKDNSNIFFLFNTENIYRDPGSQYMFFVIPYLSGYKAGFLSL